MTKSLTPTLHLVVDENVGIEDHEPELEDE
jgi:hypothetical protein